MTNSKKQTTVDDFMRSLPTPTEVRARIGENANEAKLLRKLLRMAEDRERAKKCREAASC